MDDLEAALWDLEKRFWLDGADFYESRLADGAVMVLPYPALLMERDAAVEAVRHAPRWTEVQLAETSFRRRGAAAVLAYRATAWRPEGGEEPYAAVCASTYVEDDDGEWLMLSHSQQALTVPEDATQDA